MNVTDNTISYLKQYGHLTFEEKEFNVVDSLIVCQISYFKFDQIIGDIEGKAEALPIKSFRYHRSYANLFGDARYAEQYKAFYVALYNSIRFREVTLNYYMDLVDEELEVQFSAVTIFIGGAAYVTFRGTDENMIGWKEDFNMAFLSPIPAQVAARRYLQYIAELWEGDLIVGGHSKGGNGAIYAAMEIEAAIQRRIRRVYCFDGPGFRDDVYQTKGYLAIERRISKMVPKASVVGMLLQNKVNYRVVKSIGRGALQHDSFNWLVKDGAFDYDKELYKISIYKNRVLNKWICACRPERLQVFVNGLFQIIGLLFKNENSIKK